MLNETRGHSRPPPTTLHHRFACTAPVVEEMEAGRDHLDALEPRTDCPRPTVDADLGPDRHVEHEDRRAVLCEAQCSVWVKLPGTRPAGYDSHRLLWVGGRQGARALHEVPGRWRGVHVGEAAPFARGG